MLHSANLYLLRICRQPGSWHIQTRKMEPTIPKGISRVCREHGAELHDSVSRTVMEIRMPSLGTAEDGGPALPGGGRGHQRMGHPSQPGGVYQHRRRGSTGGRPACGQRGIAPARQAPARSGDHDDPMIRVTDRKSTRLNSSHTLASRMPSSA